jgi:hypothetical protein
MRARVVFFVVLAAAILAACGVGGGGGGGSFCCPATPTPTPIPLPSSDATSAGLSTTTTTAVQFAAIASGASGTITLPAVNARTTATLSFASSLPSGVSTPSMRAVRGRAIIGGTNLTTLASITLSVNSTITIASTPAFTFSFSSAPSGNAYIAFYDENNAAGGWNVVLGPGTISGNGISFAAAPISPPLTLVPNDTYVFALVTSGTAVTPAAISLSGSITETDSFNYPTPSPFPSTSQSGAITESVSAAHSPSPVSTPAGGTLIGYYESESIAYPLETTTTAGDAWYASVPSTTSSGTTNIEYLASQLNVGTTYVETLYKNGQIEDELPETSGATWTNSPAATIITIYSDLSHSSSTVNADGSYTETYTDPLGYTLIIATNANGSGTYSGTEFTAAYGIDGYAMSAPSGSSITVSIVPTPAPSGQPSATPFPINTPAAWFTPATTGLYSETDTQTTSVTYPAVCGVPSTFGTSGGHIATTISRIDPVIGTLDDETIDTYTSPSFGPVCQVLQDKTIGYYDYALDSAYVIVDFTGGKQQTTTMSETLTLQTAPLSSVFLTHARRQFDAALAVRRSAVLRGFAQRLEALAKKRGVVQ